MKAIIIARVSTEEQKEANNSLPAQTFRLKKYCQNKGFEIIREFSFDESAYKDQRGDFDSILDFIFEQKEKIAVCFDKVDRLSRNIFDKRVSLLYAKALRDEVELHFVSDGQVINSQLSAVEKFNFNISLGLASYYSNAISDNVKRSFEQKLRRGELPGKAHYGYRNIILEGSKKDIVVDEYPAGIVKQVFEWYATGAYSMNLTREKLDSEYGIKWSKGFLDHVLKNKFYFGIMTIKGKTYEHKYQPIISKVLFDRVQTVKAGFNKKRYKFVGLPFLYRGLIRCGQCNLSVTPERHKGHVYYHCTQYNGKHGAHWMTEEAITERLASLYKRMQFPGDIVQHIVDALNTTHQAKMEFHNKQYDEIVAKRKDITKMQDNLYMDKLKGSITDSEYDRFYQKFRNEIDELDTRQAILQEAEDNYFVTAKSILDISNRAYDLFLRSEVEERRQLIKLTLQNLRIEGKELCYDAVKPFDTILNFADSQSWLPIAEDVRKCFVEEYV